MTNPLDAIIRRDGELLRMQDNDRDYRHEQFLREMDEDREERLYGH